MGEDFGDFTRLGTREWLDAPPAGRGAKQPRQPAQDVARHGRGNERGTAPKARGRARAGGASPQKTDSES